MLLRVTNRAANFLLKRHLAGYRRFACALLLAFIALPAISAQEPSQTPPPNSSTPPVARPVPPAGGAFSSNSPPQTPPDVATSTLAAAQSEIRFLGYRLQVVSQWPASNRKRAVLDGITRRLTSIAQTAMLRTEIKDLMRMSCKMMDDIFRSE